ncbi:Meiotic recombination protein rec12 [Pseudocercospora fuligena]|uniref:DNA topoisomerase (ATP-hydrolyzing) n=1 Tax=Pseudocercospora fuligena TaxID=685502 RepID=A0A8H6VMK7_9PEZI|nr:Meiotic recombination protein rec12 [Pseudocercospora fuligena]
MDEDDFDDLFSEIELLQPLSQGSLIDTAADLTIHQDDTGDDLDASPNASRQDYTLHEEHSPVKQKAVDRIYPNGDVIDKIEAVMEQMVDALLNDKTEISVTLRTRRATSTNKSTKPANSGLRDATAPSRTLHFPGKSEDEAWRVAVVLRIMELMHEALRNDVVISKRDMYYRDPALFGSQRHVDRYVDDIAFTFGVPRSALNITAAAKGLFAGAFELCRRDGSTIDAATDPEGILIPSLRDILSVSMSKVKWILVIEKEATFRSIAGSDFWSTIIQQGILITGKGYPDLLSRAILRFLSRPSLQNGFSSPPVYGLADFDPDGIAILSVYKHGSKALAHEKEDHAVPEMKWLGLRSTHLSLAASDIRGSQGLLTLSSRDRKKAVKMLEGVDSSVNGDSDAKRELQMMLMLNTKAELQLLDAVPHGMTDLLQSMTKDVNAT